jgi:hypothetical protein
MGIPFAESHHQFFSCVDFVFGGGGDGGNMLGGGGGGGRLFKSISLEWGMGSGSLMGSLLGATGFGILTTFFGGVETLGRGDGFCIVGGRNLGTGGGALAFRGQASSVVQI